MADRWRFNDKRRSVLRGIARLERDGANAEYVQAVRDLVSDSYLRSNKSRNIVGRSPYVVGASLAEAREMIAAYDLLGNDAYTPNSLFEAEWRRGARGGTSTFSADDVNSFYAATKDIWGPKKGVRTRALSGVERHYAIIDYVNAHSEEFDGVTVSTFREAYEAITGNEAYASAVERVRDRYEAGEIQDFYSEVVNYISGMFRG